MTTTTDRQAARRVSKVDRFLTFIRIFLVGLVVVGLTAFIAQAAAEDLFVTLRIGPYVCGEYYFGGIPVWVRSLKDIQCFRCADPVWETYMERWTRQVVQQVEPLLASNGGPIVMMQIENEYNGDLSYQNWAVQMARNITTSVPWNLCHSQSLCTQINNLHQGYKLNNQARKQHHQGWKLSKATRAHSCTARARRTSTRAPPRASKPSK